MHWAQIWLLKAKGLGMDEEILDSQTHMKYIYHMGVSKNSGTLKWMVRIMENPNKIDDLGVPLFLETPIYTSYGKGTSQYSSS